MAYFELLKYINTQIISPPEQLEQKLTHML